MQVMVHTQNLQITYVMALIKAFLAMKFTKYHGNPW